MNIQTKISKIEKKKLDYYSMIINNLMINKYIYIYILNYIKLY